MLSSFLASMGILPYSALVIVKCNSKSDWFRNGKINPPTKIFSFSTKCYGIYIRSFTHHPYPTLGDKTALIDKFGAGFQTHLGT